MGRTYLVRYGVSRTVGRLAADAAYDRGQAVVIRTHRGTELGDVLLDAPPGEGDGDAEARILRAASADDLALALRRTADAPRRFELCQAIFADGTWPIDLIDVEALLDDRTVLLYLGPHQLDAAGLVAALRVRCGLEVVLEPAGIDASEPEPEPAHPADEPGGCGAPGCGEGGCGTGGGGGCSTCPAKTLISSRSRRAPVTS